VATFHITICGLANAKPAHKIGGYSVAADDYYFVEGMKEWARVSQYRTSNQPPPVSPLPRPQESAQTAGNPLCHTCRQGALTKRTKFRMSGPVVVIGFVLLIPSVLGMLFGVLMLIITGAASTQTSTATERDIRARLVAHDVPEPIIGELVSGKAISDDELVPLTYQQRAAVHDAQLSASAQKVGAGAATVIAGGFSIFVIIASFVGGLLGWLLIMRKRVLECSRCGAIVPAS